MNDFIITAAKFHKLMEINLKAKDHHKLNFSEYNLEKITKTTSGSNLTKDIKEIKIKL